MKIIKKMVIQSLINKYDYNIKSLGIEMAYPNRVPETEEGKKRDKEMLESIKESRNKIELLESILIEL